MYRAHANQSGIPESLRGRPEISGMDVLFVGNDLQILADLCVSVTITSATTVRPKADGGRGGRREQRVQVVPAATPHAGLVLVAQHRHLALCELATRWFEARSAS